MLQFADQSDTPHCDRALRNSVQPMPQRAVRYQGTIKTAGADNDRTAPLDEIRNHRLDRNQRQAALGTPNAQPPFDPKTAGRTKAAGPGRTLNCGKGDSPPGGALIGHIWQFPAKGGNNAAPAID
jgi:hypothetical protein